MKFFYTNEEEAKKLEEEAARREEQRLARNLFGRVSSFCFVPYCMLSSHRSSSGRSINAASVLFFSEACSRQHGAAAHHSGRKDGAPFRINPLYRLP
jgi:hypothetical protein